MPRDYIKRRLRSILSPLGQPALQREEVHITMRIYGAGEMLHLPVLNTMRDLIPLLKAQKDIPHQVKQQQQQQQYSTGTTNLLIPAPHLHKKYRKPPPYLKLLTCSSVSFMVASSPMS